MRTIAGRSDMRAGRMVYGEDMVTGFREGNFEMEMRFGLYGKGGRQGAVRLNSDPNSE